MLATIVQSITAVVLILICVLLILVVLLQKGRGGGLAGAFGGAGGHSAFGAKTGDVFTWVTVGLTFAFILVAVIGNWVFVPERLGGATTTVQQTATEVPADTAEQPALPPTATQPGA